MIKHLSISGIYHSQHAIDAVDVLGVALFYDGYLIPMEFDTQIVNLYDFDDYYNCADYTIELDDLQNIHFPYELLPNQLDPFYMSVDDLQECQIVVYINNPDTEVHELYFMIAYDENDCIVFQNDIDIVSQGLPDMDLPGEDDFRYLAS